MCRTLSAPVLGAPLSFTATITRGAGPAGIEAGVPVAETIAEETAKIG